MRQLLTPEQLVRFENWGERMEVYWLTLPYCFPLGKVGCFLEFFRFVWVFWEVFCFVKNKL